MTARRSSRGRSAVLLDRDGVLNEAVVVAGRPYPPASVDQLVVLPEVIAVCEQLREAGLLLIVVTNQPDLARGTADRASVDAINRELSRRLELDDVLVCPHDDGDACACRKPAPGLLHQAAERWGLELARSVMVGDRWRDIEAGRRAGCATVLIDRDYRERRAEAPDLVVHALSEAVPWIVRVTSLSKGKEAYDHASIG